MLLEIGFSFAQLSPLFQTPSLNFDLPIFNPAFTGDTDNYRAFLSLATLKPGVSGVTNNTSTLISLDKKFAPNNLNTLFTIGASLQYNRVNISADLDQLASQSAALFDETFYNYGTGEISFGIRIPTRYTYKKKDKKEGNTSAKIYKDKRRNKRKYPSSNPNRTDFDNLNNSAYCSFNSAQDYISFSLATGSNFAGLSNGDSGLIFNDQISYNSINNISSGVLADPFIINSTSSDQVLSNNSLQSVTSLYFGAGLLYHMVLNDFSSIRFSYSMKNMFRGYVSIPESEQKLAPLKTFQVRYNTLLNEHQGLNLSVLYIDQNSGLFPIFGDPIKQWRFGVTNSWYFQAHSKNIKKGIYLTGLDIGLTPYYFNKSISTFSILLGAKFKSNTDFNNTTKIVNKSKYERQNYSGKVWLFFINYDFHTSAKLSNRNTSGNVRVGVTLEGWNR